jgi:hypothetical protein
VVVKMAFAMEMELMLSTYASGTVVSRGQPASEGGAALSRKLAFMESWKQKQKGKR